MRSGRTLSIGIAATLTVCLLLWPSATPQIQERGKPPAEDIDDLDRGPLVLEGAAPDMAIIYTGQVEGYVEPCGCPVNPAGGLARRAGYLKLFRDKFPETTVVLADTGNFAGAPDSAGRFKTQNLIEGMGTMKYDVLNVGPRELGDGIARFRTVSENANLSFINANFVYRDNGEPLLPPFDIKEYTLSAGRKVKVGFLGLNSYDSSFAKETPEGRVVIMREPVEATRKFVPGLRARVDMVVLLGNLSPRDLTAILAAEEGIDIALVSYGVRVSNGALETIRDVPVFYAGDQGKRLGEVRVRFREGEPPVFFGSHVYLTKRYPAEPGLQQLIDKTIVQVNRINEMKAAGAAGAASAGSTSAAAAPGRSPERRGGNPGVPARGATATPPVPAFLTAVSCANCHPDAHDIWYRSHHARAFDTLVQADQDYNPECVKCHVTGYEQPQGFLNARQTPDLVNVQCEACHGNATDHVADLQKPFGNVPPRQCYTCHTKENSPDFVFFKYWNMIKH